MLLEIHTGSFGVMGSKSHFHQKCYFSYSLHGIIMRLKHIHQLDTLYKLRVWKFTLGHLGSQGSNGNFQQKNGITCPCYIAWQLDSYMCICLNPSIYVKCQPGGIWGQILIFMLIAISPYPAGAAAGSYIASVSSSSSFFFLSTSLFLQQLTWYDHVTQVYS